MKNNIRKEKIGANFLEGLCLTSPYLEPQVSSNDRTPSFDGDVFVYKKTMPFDSSGYQKKYLEGKVAIQVKTTELKSLDCSSIKYSVDISDLENYYRNNGVLFFVVAIDEKNNQKKHLFYNDLTPLKIEDILDKNKKNKKKLKISLNFLKLNSDIDYIFRNFIDSIKRQTIFDYQNDKFVSLNDLEKFYNSTEEIDIKYTVCENKLFNAEVYIKDKQKDIMVPFSFKSSKDIVESSFVGSIYEIKIDNKTFYKKHDIKKLINFSMINNISIVLSDNLCLDVVNNKLKLKAILKGDITSIIYDLQFLREVLINGHIDIGKKIFYIDVQPSILDIINSQISYFSFFLSMLKVKFKNSLSVKLQDIEKPIINCIESLYFKQLSEIKDKKCVAIKIFIDDKLEGYIIKFS